jgi:TonB family protein
MAHPLNDHPRLTLQQAILLEPDVPVPTVAIDRIGSPFGVNGPLTGGPGGPNGIGNGCCDSVGNGHGGPGFGSPNGVPNAAFSKPTTLPKLITKVEPEYSEEARKAKVQGMVTISAEIDEHGNVRKMRILQPLGLGLDERAMEAVTRWRFHPALAGNKPVACGVTIEVNFRLL